MKDNFKEIVEKADSIGLDDWCKCTNNILKKLKKKFQEWICKKRKEEEEFRKWHDPIVMNPEGNW